MRKYKEETKKKIVDEVRKGRSQIKIARQRKIPRATIWAWCKKEGLVTPMKPRVKKAIKKVKAKKATPKKQIKKKVKAKAKSVKTKPKIKAKPKAKKSSKAKAKPV